MMARTCCVASKGELTRRKCGKTTKATAEFLDVLRTMKCALRARPLQLGRLCSASEFNVSLSDR